MVKRGIYTIGARCCVNVCEWGVPAQPEDDQIAPIRLVHGVRALWLEKTKVELLRKLA